MLSVDYYIVGYDAFKQGLPKPTWDGTAQASLLIAGWERAARDVKAPGYECQCKTFSCPYHAPYGETDFG